MPVASESRGQLRCFAPDLLLAVWLLPVDFLPPEPTSRITEDEDRHDGGGDRQLVFCNHDSGWIAFIVNRFFGVPRP